MQLLGLPTGVSASVCMLSNGGSAEGKAPFHAKGDDANVPSSSSSSSYNPPDGDEVGRMIRVTLTATAGTDIALGKVVVYGKRLGEGGAGRAGGGWVEAEAKQSLEGVLQSRGSRGSGLQSVRPSWQNVHDVHTSDASLCPTVIEKGLDQGTPVTGVVLELKHSNAAEQPLEAIVRVVQPVQRSTDEGQFHHSFF